MSTININWTGRFLDLAKHVSGWSKDPSTKTGCVIAKGKDVQSFGYNGFPRGASDDPEIYADRPQKYLRVQHAEVNAIINAKRDLTGCIAYTTHLPCCNCLGALINAGITCIYTFKPEEDLNERFKDSFKATRKLSSECAVPIYELDN